LLFAGIHLAVAVPLIVWEEATRWDWLRDSEARQVALPPIAGSSDGDTVSFSPCGMWEHISAPRSIIMGADWRMLHAAWRLAVRHRLQPVTQAGPYPELVLCV
jgi:hypothetical protein